MTHIYDSIEIQLTKGLHKTLELLHRTDFCAGFFIFLLFVMQFWKNSF
jgi:hypothetical protein